MKFFTKSTLLSFLAFLLLNISASAQYNFGLKFGPNLSSQVSSYNIPNDIPDYINYSYPESTYNFKLGFHFGGYVWYQKENSKFRIQAEYLYNMKGYNSRTSRSSTQSSNGVLSPPTFDSGPSNDFSEETDHLHYFSIPLYFYYMPKDFGIGFGPEFSMLGNYLADYQGEFADFALNGMVIYKINPKVELNLSGSYGLKNVTGSSVQKKKNVNFQFSLAYQMINLKKK